MSTHQTIKLVWKKFRNLKNKIIGGNQIHQSQPDDEKQLTELVTRGNQLIKEKNTAEAENIFQTVVAQNPNAADGYAGLAQIAQAKKNWQQVLEYWDKCFSINRKNYPAWWLIKKANVLIQLAQYEEAEILLDEYIQREPDQVWGFVATAEIAKRQGLPKKELKVLNTIYKKFPEHTQTHLKYLNKLTELGHFEKAETIAQGLVKEDPNSGELLEFLANNAKLAKDFPLAKSRAEELTQKFPDNDDYKRKFVKSLLNVTEFDKAQAYFNQYLNDFSKPENIVLQAKMYWDMTEIEKAEKLLTKYLKVFPNNQVIILYYIFVLTKNAIQFDDQGYFLRAITLIDKYAEKVGLNDNLLIRKMEINMQLGNLDKVVELFGNLQCKTSENAMIYKAWIHHYRGEDEQAKATWKDIEDRFFIPQFQHPAKGTLKKTDTRQISIKKGSIVLLTAVRNELWRLPWFLDYYRKIGVDKFFVIDNDSSDGTSEYLQQQEDVYVFWTDQPYTQSYSAIRWINYLVEVYGSDSWCMYVDVDEAIVFPGIENRNLKQLTRYMDKNGYEALSAFMLDMFSASPIDIATDAPYDGFQEDYPYFENKYKTHNSVRCPWVYVRGGVRKRFKVNEKLTKTPLIRGGKGIKFIASSHDITPAILCNVTGALFHYKLAGDYKKLYLKDLKENARNPACNRRHTAYVNAAPIDFEKIKNEGNVEVFKSSRQLVSLGLIKNANEFEIFCNDQD